MLSLRIVVAGLVVLAGCSGGAGADGAPPAACTKAGERCLFAPGKLGLCVEASVESTTPKIVCQSQH